VSADFTHHFAPGTASDQRTLLLLHGTGGNEDSLVPLGRALAPGAALLGVRGKVLENGMPRFFRRIAEGVFDEADLVARTHELADFLEGASRRYGFPLAATTAVGFSNGANIAAALLLLHPGLIRSAMLFRAMVPFEPQDRPDLRGTSVLLSEGRFDPLIAAANANRLGQILEQCGATVDLDWIEAGHHLTPEEARNGAAWFEALP
jgi:phospholipase/carboxylesterase